MRPTDLRAAIYSAVLALIVAIFGAVAQYVLAKRKEDLVQRQTASFKRLQSQIEELYGPLHGLTQRLGKIYDLVCALLPTGDQGTIDPSRFSEADWNIAGFFIDEYFLPLHTEVETLLRTKTHLLEPGELPPGFAKFYDHEARFECLYRLWKEKDVAWAPSVSDLEWPQEFERDVSEVLHRLRSRQEQYLAAMR